MTTDLSLIHIQMCIRDSIKALLSIRNLLSGLDSHEKDTGNKEDHGNDEPVSYTHLEIINAEENTDDTEE